MKPTVGMGGPMGYSRVHPGEQESPKSNVSSVIDVRDSEMKQQMQQDDNSPQKSKAVTGETSSVTVSILVCSFYVTVSGAMVFLNKALSHEFGFTTTNALLFMQMLWQIALVSLLSHRSGLAEIEPLCWVNARKIAPVSFFYCLNSACALAALRELSVPSYSVIKRLAPLVTLVLESSLLGKRAETGVVVSLLVMAAGTIMVAQADVTGSALGWILGALSNVLQAMYLVYVKKTGAEKGFSSLTILYYHSILSLPFLAILTVALGEVKPLIEFPLWWAPDFLFMLVLCLSMGLLLNYSLFLCTEKTSATSTLVSGQFKAIGQTVIGLFTFGGVQTSPLFDLGLVANILGGFGYAYCKYKSIAK
mmetsp:Transcript_10207/g.20588  ORF Transcript_10207/g.20588 Transcript_10207/m.20588 type:complete len:363 (-) Transcript_10207:656-1744(-)